MTENNDLKNLQELKSKGALTDEEYFAAIGQLHKKETKQSFISHFNTLSPEEKRSKIMFIIILAGISCILAGVGLMIGANWSIIPNAVKLGGGLGLLALSLMGVFYTHSIGKNAWKEVLLFVSFFLIGGNMAIIQQSFNLAITWNEGCAIWWFLSLPLLFLTRLKFLPFCSVVLFVFGTWEYLSDLIRFLNYMMIAGILSIFVFLSFLGGKKVSLLRNIAFCLAIFTLFCGDIGADSVAGVISTVIFLIMLGTLPKSEDREVRFCHYMFIFMAFRVFLLFCGAYYNLMSIGIQLVFFGTLLLILTGGYYYFFNNIQNFFNKLVHHE